MHTTTSLSYILLLAFVLALMSSCSMKVKSLMSNETLAPLEETAEVIVLTETQVLPPDHVPIGTLRVKEKGMSINCNYKNAIDLAKSEARQKGANIIHLTEVGQPFFGSVCYEISGNLYHSADPKKLAELHSIVEASNATTLSENSDYAYVHFFRPKRFAGSGIGYKIRDEEGIVIGRARNGESFSYKVTKPGLTKFSAKTEKTTEILLDVEMGKEYYVNCAVKYGLLIARPDLYEVDRVVGRSRFDALVAR